MWKVAFYGYIIENYPSHVCLHFGQMPFLETVLLFVTVVV